MRNQLLNSTTHTLAVNACLLVLESEDVIDGFSSINARFSASRIETLLQDIAVLLDAKVLGISSTGYEPLGASAALLIGQAEAGQPEIEQEEVTQEIIGQGDATLLHLDKSHLAAHTYFEKDEASPWRSFRFELELSTCGDLPKAALLERLVQEFDFDMLMLDMKVRGFKRNCSGQLELASNENAEGITLDRYALLVEQTSAVGSFVVLQANDLSTAKLDEWARLLPLGSNRNS